MGFQFDAAKLARLDVDPERVSVPKELAAAIWRQCHREGDAPALFVRPMTGYEKNHCDGMLLVTQIDAKTKRYDARIDLTRQADQIAWAIAATVEDEAGKSVLSEAEAKALSPAVSELLKSAINHLVEGDEGKEGLRAVS